MMMMMGCEWVGGWIVMLLLCWVVLCIADERDGRELVFVGEYMNECLFSCDVFLYHVFSVGCGLDVRRWGCWSYTRGGGRREYED